MRDCQYIYFANIGIMDRLLIRLFLCYNEIRPKDKK